MIEKIQRVQSLLKKEKIDGWLLYDFQKRNPLAIEFLEIPSSQFLSRRLFYWIPAEGEPVKVVHATEAHVLPKSLPGKSIAYFKWLSLEEALKKLLKGVSSVAMEYSPRCAIPAISLVDGGMLDLVREMGPKIVSSSRLLQEFTSILTIDQYKTHQEAAHILDRSIEAAWDFLAECLKKGRKVTEYDVQQYISIYLEKEGCMFEGGPICAVNENSSNPHYIPTLNHHKEVRKGDFVLIDAWCKKTSPRAIYADICKVAVADEKAKPLQQEIFSIVKKAQEEATSLVRESFLEKKTLRGYEVDLAARKVVEEAGFGEYFIHRTGHNIYTQDHGPGTHMDSLETLDDRLILPNTCFSIEPGIYLPGKFGVRLEYDLFITQDGKVEVNGGIQAEIKQLL